MAKPDFIDADGDGDKKEPMKKALKDKTNKKRVRNEQNKTDITRFIGEVSKKNYAEANKYLQAALEDKMKGRIAATQHKLGF